MTGDGDALSIGGNHLIHALRRNVNLTILLFNNRIYGLTKGQYSPTSERGKVTKSTPLGSVDQPFNPLSIAIGAEATFVARAIDTDKQGTVEVLRAAAAHRGAAFVEILQNCNIYNDGAFDVVREEKENRLYLKAGEEVRWGDRGVRMRPDGTLEIVDASVGGLLRHDPGRDDPGLAFALARLTWETAGGVPLGIFRAVERPVYEDLVHEQLRVSVERKGEGDLQASSTARTRGRSADRAPSAGRAASAARRARGRRATPRPASEPPSARGEPLELPPAPRTSAPPAGVAATITPRASSGSGRRSARPRTWSASTSARPSRRSSERVGERAEAERAVVGDGRERDRLERRERARLRIPTVPLAHERQQEPLDRLGHLARLGDLDAHPGSTASSARRRRRAGVTKTAITAATAAAIAESMNALT